MRNGRSFLSCWTHFDWHDLNVPNIASQFNHKLHVGYCLLYILVNQVSPVKRGIHASDIYYTERQTETDTQLEHRETDS